MLEQAKEIKPVKYPQIREVVETYYALQHLRIQASNRLGAYERMGLDPKISKARHNWVDERLESFESELRRVLEKEVIHFPIWEKFFYRVHGIGPALACSLIAWVDITKVERPSQLWRYCGLGVIDGKSERRVRGEKLHYSSILKTTCWKIGEQFVRQGRYYREVYDTYKHRIRELHPEPVETDKKSKEGKPIKLWSDGHVHAMAKRYAVKRFLNDLYVEWRTLEGLPVSKPYVIEKLGHTTYYAPPVEGDI